MFGFAFSKVAMSATHSLCCTGLFACVGAQLMLTVTLPPLEALEEPLLEQAAAARLSPARATTAATWRKPASRYAFLVFDQPSGGLNVAYLRLQELHICGRRSAAT